MYETFLATVAFRPKGMKESRFKPKCTRVVNLAGLLEISGAESMGQSLFKAKRMGQLFPFKPKRTGLF